MNDIDLVTTDLTTTSLAIAELFGREVKSINRTIKNIINDADPAKISRCKIAPLKYTDSRGKEQSMYELGEEMALIITGRLTGKNAFDAQIRLAESFIAMRNYIKSQQVSMSHDDREMLEMTRINPNTLKAISKTRSNAKVRENYQALVELGILEELVETRKVIRYRFTSDGADYSHGYFHGIPRFEPELHKQITAVLTAFKKGIEHQNDLFIAKD